MIAGVDGCRSGWLAVFDDEAGRRWSKVCATFADLLDSEASVVVIDIPIGIMTDVPRVVDGAEPRAPGWLVAGWLPQRACSPVQDDLTLSH